MPGSSSKDIFWNKSRSRISASEFLCYLEMFLCLFKLKFPIDDKDSSGYHHYFLAENLERTKEGAVGVFSSKWWYVCLSRAMWISSKATDVIWEIKSAKSVPVQLYWCLSLNTYVQMLMQADTRHNHTFTCNTDQESLQWGLPWWTDTGLTPGETETGTVPVL